MDEKHLKIISFWRLTLNVVKIEMYLGVIAYFRVALVGYKLKGYPFNQGNPRDFRIPSV